MTFLGETFYLWSIVVVSTPWLVAARGAGPGGMFTSLQLERMRKCEQFRCNHGGTVENPTRVLMDRELQSVVR